MLGQFSFHIVLYLDFWNFKQRAKDIFGARSVCTRVQPIILQTIFCICLLVLWTLWAIFNWKFGGIESRPRYICPFLWYFYIKWWFLASTFNKCIESARFVHFWVRIGLILWLPLFRNNIEARWSQFEDHSRPIFYQLVNLRNHLKLLSWTRGA